ncbi:hypothetical protein [Streptomyces avermitilis]|uniref:hypothetical protein n=1 Tax=Streptomyces avermitilis TaxID=33903 RepID=UPI003809159F
MITTMPVGSWSWETKAQSPGEDLVVRCARQVLDVWAVLLSLRLAEGAAQADITIGAKDDGAVLWQAKRVHVPPLGMGAERELMPIPAWLDQDRAGVVTIDLGTPGTCLRDGEARLVQKLFEISVDAWASGAGTVTLRTFSDAWMSHDLRGHRQPEVQCENAPRLAAALAAITRLTEAEIVPADPTSYGVPTENGFEDLPDEDPDLLDSWYMFEVPRRTEWLQGKIPPNAQRYEAQAESAVEFFEVAVDGHVVGYLWAADDEGAAGYEPRTPAGDVALDAGEEWLARLSEAKQRGLSPSEALRELATWPGNSRSGAVVPGLPREAPTLEDLQELSGRE